MNIGKLVGLLLISCLFNITGSTNESEVGVKENYLFTSFRGNGEDDLHLAYSHDGLKWTALNGDKSFLKPQVGTKLMRDPCICQGPDGTFHMVWTSGWWDKGIGIAHSKDFKEWETITDELVFPKDTRRGTAFKVSDEILNALLELK